MFKKISLFLFAVLLIQSVPLHSRELLKEICKAYVGKVSYYFTDQPLIIKDKIYVTTYGDSPGDDSRDKVYAFTKNCKKLWTFSPPNTKGTNINGIVGNENMLIVGTEGGKVYALDPDNGTLQWNFDIGAKVKGFTIGDTNFDGVPEVAITGWNRKIILLDYRGEVIFEKDLGSIINSSPSIVDVTGTAQPEIVVSTDNGDVFILDSSGNILTTYSTPTAIRSSPVFADLNLDDEADIIFGNDDNVLFAVTGKGEKLWEFHTGDRITASPSLADLNHDGIPEILFPSEDHNLYCLNSNGKLLWKHGSIEGITASPVVADLNGDGTPEIIYVDLDKKLNVLNTEGKLLFTTTVGDMNFTTPAAGDINGNGKIDIVFTSSDGYMYLFESTIPSGLISWGRWRGNGDGSGYYPDAIIFSYTYLQPEQR